MTLERKPFEVEALRLAPWTAPDSEAAQAVEVPGNSRLSGDQKDIEGYLEGAWRSLTLLRDYQYAQDDAESSVIGTVFTDKVSITTPTLTGTYRLQWKLEFQAQARLGIVRLHDVTNDATWEESRQLLDASTWVPWSGFVDVAFAAQARTIALQYALESVTGQAAVRVRRARLAIARVA